MTDSPNGAASAPDAGAAAATAAGTVAARDLGEPLLEVRDLRVHFPQRKGVIFQSEVGTIRAVDGVDLTVHKGETLGLVGESGCGKSTTARAIIGLTRAPIARVTGSVKFDGQEILGVGGNELRDARRSLQMIFQDPFASLDPRMTVGAIVSEPLRNFGIARGRESEGRVGELLETVGLSREHALRYPHEFSGGQRQRIGVARALAPEPRMILADEPVSALDVSIQAQIVNLLEDLRTRFGLTTLFIAHDLAIVRHISDRVAVMYLGTVVEIADKVAIYEEPLHPYTRALLSAIPIPDPAVEAKRRRILLTGDVPSPDREYPGCRFADRCPLRRKLSRTDQARCDEEPPKLHDARTGHAVACHFPDESV